MIGLPLPQQLDKIADAVSKFADGGNKTAIVMELLGRTGAQMIPMLDKGSAGFKELQQRAEDAGAIITGRGVEALAKLNTATGTVWAALRGLGGELVGEVAPDMVTFADKVTTSASNLHALVVNGTLGAYSMEVLKGSVEIAALQLEKLAVAFADIGSFHWADLGKDMEAINKQIADVANNEMKHTQEILDKALGAYHKIVEETGAGTPKPSPPALAIPDTGALKAAMDQYQTVIKLADDSFNQTRDHLSAEARLHEITYGEETAQLLAALDQRYAAQNTAIDGELTLYGHGTEEYQKAVDQRREIDAKYAADRQKIMDQAAEQDAKIWKQDADTIAGAFNSGLSKVLTGTATWGQAMKKVSADLVLKMIEDQIKLSVEFLAEQARRLAVTIATQTGMTSATAVGAAARATAETISGQTSILQTVANALKAIFSSAGQTTAEVSAAVAPEAGPAAPAIGAAAGAAVVASATGMLYDVGTDYILNTGLAIVHQGEQIVPAKGTGPYTGSRSGEGSSGALAKLVSDHREAMGLMLDQHARSNSALISELASFRQASKRLRHG